MTVNKQQKVFFILSVDTEEEWEWAGSFPQEDYGLDNIKLLQPFQTLCDQLGIKPTYFVDYAVLNCDTSGAIVESLIEQGNAEIGAHLHPWSNPPYYGVTGEKESHMINLPEEQVRAKLEELVAIIREKLSVEPKSFRTGRWGIDSMVLKLLKEYGFTIDSSVIPYYENEFFSCYGCPNQPYYPDWINPLVESSQREMLEVPVTSGFNRANYGLSSSIHKLIAKPVFEPFKFVGAAWQLKLLRKMFLSPELTELDDMKSLCKSEMANGHQVIHMFIHSSSLIDNPNSQVGNEKAYDTLTRSITDLVSWLKGECDLEFCTISEYAQIKHAQEAGK